MRALCEGEIMNFKKSLCSLIALWTLSLPLGAGVDFEWRLSLNNRYHADPYGYRYGLVERFRLPESRVVVILDSVRDPADAYMIFRLSELSGRPYEHVLTVYRQNRYSSWFEIAALVGILIDSREFNELRHRHDLRDDYRFDNRRYDRYEDRRVVIRREEIYVPHVYQEQQRMYREPEPRHREHFDSRDRRDNDERYEGRRR